MAASGGLFSCPLVMGVIVYGSYMEWHIVIPIKKWWITFSWLPESTTHSKPFKKSNLHINFKGISVYESYLEWILNRDSNQEWLTEYKHIGIKQFIKYI